MYRIIDRTSGEIDVPISPRPFHTHLPSAVKRPYTHEAVELDFWPHRWRLSLWLGLGRPIGLRCDTILIRVITRGLGNMAIGFVVPICTIRTVLLLLIHHIALSTWEVPEIVDPVDLPH
jgi:hypothetical protein